jgi:Fe-S cluster assembly ATP-binding protein
MIQIDDLSVKVENKLILEDVYLHIEKGETHVLFGPNGSGKSTLVNVIMGNPKYNVTKGQIYFKGKEILSMSVDERARLGIGIIHQHPPAITGVKLNSLLDLISKRGEKEVDEVIKTLKMDSFLKRDMNVGFSGGEIKRSEMLQIYSQKPEFIMFDEPDSGVDVENIEILGNVINEILDKNKKVSERKVSGLIITHLGHIFKYINVDKAHVLYNKQISCSGNPNEILNHIMKDGYEGCVQCYQKKEVTN